MLGFAKLDWRFFLGVVAYLRQAALSLHRADNAEQLEGFYRERVALTPGLVADALLLRQAVDWDQRARLDHGSASELLLGGWHGLARTGVSFLARLFWRAAFVPLDELAYARMALVRLETLFRTGKGWDERIGLRLDLSYAEGRLESRLGSQTEKRRAADVLYLDHGYPEGRLSVEAIAGGDWMERSPAAFGLRCVPASVSARARGIDTTPLAPLVARIVKACAPEQVWLFGSRARGHARPDSDWDLLVVVADGVDDSQFDPLVAWKMQAGSGVPADVILCRASELREDRRTPNTIAYEVDRDGLLVYQRGGGEFQTGRSLCRGGA